MPALQGVMRVPSGGRLASEALVRRMIQWESSHGLEGSL